MSMVGNPKRSRVDAGLEFRLKKKKRQSKRDTNCLK